LKHLSEAGTCTVVCTIHQPQQKIFNLFDNLILLKKGTIVYSGSCQKSLLFLESIGLPCPSGINPADHLLDIISSPGDHVERDEKLKVPIDLTMGMEKGFLFDDDRATWLRQIGILFRRNFHQYIRKPDIILLSLVSTSLIAIFIGGGIWYKQQLNQIGATTLVPSLFFTCVTQGIFGSLQVVNTFPSERAVMLRERSAGAYNVSAYYIAKTAVDFITQLWPPIVFTCIAYPMLGYQNTASHFFIYMVFMILDNMAATSLATAGFYYTFFYFAFF
jgi:ATP-binding cassette subfamily G (WHITE) protein 2